MRYLQQASGIFWKHRGVYVFVDERTRNILVSNQKNDGRHRQLLLIIVYLRRTEETRRKPDGVHKRTGLPRDGGKMICKCSLVAVEEWLRKEILNVSKTKGNIAHATAHYSRPRYYYVYHLYRVWSAAVFRIYFLFTRKSCK